MADNKILQSILDGQVQIREDIKRVEKKVGEVEKNLESRIDTLGFQLANLEDDAPTVEEFDRLEKRVEKIEKRFTSP